MHALCVTGYHGWHDCMRALPVVLEELMPDGRTIDALEDGLADDIPPFLRKPAAGTIEAGQFWLSCINARLRKLEALGLRPYAQLLENNAEMERWVRGEGVGEAFPEAMRRGGWF